MLIVDFYTRQIFFPNFASLFLNPFYFARKGLVKHIQELAPKLKGKMLDIGCGMKPYRQLFKVPEYIGLEIDTPNNRKSKRADSYYDGKTFPFPDCTFDSLLSSQVFEHIFEPENFLKEAYRVLKPGGFFLLTVPFIWDEHEIPCDFARYSSFGIKYILDKYGFQIVTHKKTMNDLRVIFQLIAAYLYKILPHRAPYLRIFLLFLFTGPINILGELFAIFTPKNNDLYLDNIVLCRKK